MYDADHNRALYTADMELFAARGTWTVVWNGLVCNTDDVGCTYRNGEGETVFCYPLSAGGGD